MKAFYSALRNLTVSCSYCLVLYNSLLLSLISFFFSFWSTCNLVFLRYLMLCKQVCCSFYFNKDNRKYHKTSSLMFENLSKIELISTIFELVAWKIYKKYKSRVSNSICVVTKRNSVNSTVMITQSLFKIMKLSLVYIYRFFFFFLLLQFIFFGFL